MSYIDKGFIFLILYGLVGIAAVVLIGPRTESIEKTSFAALTLIVVASAITMLYCIKKHEDKKPNKTEKKELVSFETALKRR